MAFTTEFVMGAGASTQQANLVWQASGSEMTSTLLAELNADERGIILVRGSFVRGTSSGTGAPEIEIGGTLLTPTEAEVESGIMVESSGSVQIRARSRNVRESSLHAVAYVFPKFFLPRYQVPPASGGSIVCPQDVWVTVFTHTVTASGAMRLASNVSLPSYTSWSQEVSIGGRIQWQTVNSTVSTNAGVCPSIEQKVNAGDVIEYRVRAHASTTPSRTVNSWSYALL